jgi:hypothetical protein
MTRLELVSGATASPGAVREPNNKGAWVFPLTGSSSVTVQLLTATATFHGACAYAINYPPVGQYTAANKIKFTGTPPFYLTYSSGSATTVTREQAENEYELAGALTSFTDASGAPGELKCINPMVQTLAASAPGFCAGSAGVQLSLQGTQSGAKYWLYRGGTPVGTVLSGNGTATAFSGSYTAGSYTARSVKAGAFCEMVMGGTVLVNAIPMPVTPKIAVSASTVCQNTNVTFSVSSPIAGTTYTWSGSPAGVAGGTGNATYTVDASADEKSVSVYASVTSGGITCLSANAATVSVSVVAPAAPAVVQGRFCFGLPGQLQATAARGVNVAWYDAPTAGNLLASGNVLPLTPLCDASTPSYYAEARTENNCVSSRTQAAYAVNHCVINGSCPCFESGGVGSNVTPVACNALDPGQIGSAVAPVACSVFDPGQIGLARAPVACASFSAGWIGN